MIENIETAENKTECSTIKVPASLVKLRYDKMENSMNNIENFKVAFRSSEPYLLSIGILKLRTKAFKSKVTIE